MTPSANPITAVQPRPAINSSNKYKPNCLSNYPHWSPAGNSANRIVSGNYTFRVTDGNNCYDTESHFVAPVTLW
jgi:hypothetical protein